MRWYPKAIIAAVLAGAALHVGACLPPPDTTQAPDPALADVIYEGKGTPAALEALLRASPTQSAEMGPGITNPPNDIVLDARVPVTFAWSPHGAAASLTPAPGRSSPRAAPNEPAIKHLAEGRAAPSLLPIAPRSRSVLPAWLAASWLSELVGPERTASAAPAMLSGRGYFLAFSTPKTPRLLRVFTTELSYTPDAAAWKVLVGAGMWTKLVIVSADFYEDLVLGGGTYEGNDVQFCIETPAGT